MRAILCVLAFMVALGGLCALPGCFEPDQPPCAYACGDNGLCPTDYQCLPDGYCHLHGQPGSCLYPDASAALTDGGPDLAQAGDASHD
jgi:hypothetical protein